MPRGDGTGPAGMGPMTGRAAGYCAGYTVPGYANPAGGRFPRAGRFFAGGRGGRGYRNWYWATGLTGCSVIMQVCLLGSMYITCKPCYLECCSDNDSDEEKCSKSRPGLKQQIR